MNLSLLILLPVVTALVVLTCRNAKQVRVVALIGSVLQLVLVGWLTVEYSVTSIAIDLIQEVPRPQFLFEQRMDWFGAFNIQYHAGVDGISLAMIIMTALVV